MKTEQTLSIEALLLRYNRLVRAGRIRKVVGFRSRIAERFGVSKARVTNIARGMGLTSKRRRGAP